MKTYESKQRIFAFHLLNDFSGSPKVLKQAIKCWVENGYEVHLYTSDYQKGFLSDVDERVVFHAGWYRFKKNNWLRLLYYSLSQLVLILKMFSKIKKKDIVYVNTVLPFGAAVLGKLKGAEVIYHVHEVSINPRPLKWFLKKIAALTADKIIYVSKYVAEHLNIPTQKAFIIYNAIETEFVEKAQDSKPQFKQNVLMVSSLKLYKGILEFIQLASDNPDFHFKLVLNASPEETEAFFFKQKIPDNLQFFSVQKDLHPFYAWADIILNLSRPDAWIETFGLTIIEAMSYGLPAIVPEQGGIAEVIEPGKTGFLIDSRKREALNSFLRQILTQKDLYEWLSANAKERIQLFSEANFRKQNLEVIAI